MPDPAFVGPLTGSYWVAVGYLLAGPYPGGRGLTPAEERIGQVLGVGITCFVDLTQEGDLPPYTSSLPEGITYHRRPIRDFDIPTREDMRRILDTIDASIANGQKVYVHCHGGIGRTGTVVGCYLVRHGMTGAQALATIAERLHNHSPETAAQRTMILSWHD
jgi:protein-tyrosine phosphatase